MSLNNFVKLFNQLDENNSINKKIDLLIQYFKNNSDIDNIWTIFLLIDKRNKRFISGKLLRKFYSDIYELPLWLIETSYAKVGDSAEVIYLLIKDKLSEKDTIKDIALNELLKISLPKLSKLDEKEKKLNIKLLWEKTPKENQLVLNKILTGTFRVGVSKGLVTKSLGKMISIDESIIKHRLMGDLKPTSKTYNFIINKNLKQAELKYKPYPFQLANTFERELMKITSVNQYQFESKWDGIRIQLIKRLNNISIWTRGEELANNSFPELIQTISDIDFEFVLDGEILVWDTENNCPNNFSILQKRIGRKSPSLKMQHEYPIVFIAYDILELNGLDLREKYLSERRVLLEKNFKNLNLTNKSNIYKKIKITNLHTINSWEEVEEARNLARENNTEGLVIKNKESKYKGGRIKGNWWKYKVDPMQLDGVLIYARPGSGKRADLYTDYSFGLWGNNNLIKFANAYSGLSNKEIKELDRWIRKNTIDKYGPVRSVRPELVFEISFDNIQISKRHKSGIALRFPRITKWRKDKNIMEADSLENALKLLKN